MKETKASDIVADIISPEAIEAGRQSMDERNQQFLRVPGTLEVQRQAYLDGRWQFDTLGEEPKWTADKRNPNLRYDANPAGLLACAEQWWLDFYNYESRSSSRIAAPRWLTMVGLSDLGKTHLLKALFAIWRGNKLSKHLTGITTASDFAETVMARQHGRYQDWQYDQTFWLDDMGASYGNAYVESKLYELLSRRINKWTVITSNISWEQLAEDNNRPASRMIRGENVVVEVVGQPYNLRDES